MLLPHLNLPNIEPEIIALVVLASLASYYIITRVLRFIGKRMMALTRNTATQIDDIILDVVMHTNALLVLIVSLLLVLSLFDLPQKWEARLSHGWVVVIGVQLALWLNRGINLWMRSCLNHAMTPTLVFLLRFVVWVTVILSILANLGVNITAFVTSLGIGGIAIALALQNILSDLFASMSIGLDKPFEIGDFIIVNDVLGTVEHIGIKTTRIRSLSGEQIVTSNTELLKQTIRNFKRMSERRVLFSFGVTYQASTDQVKTLTTEVCKIIQSIEGTRFERAHFKQFGASALEFEVVYHVLNPDYGYYMDIQQQINLELMSVCADLGVDFAFPTTTLHFSDSDLKIKLEQSRLRAVT